MARAALVFSTPHVKLMSRRFSFKVAVTLLPPETTEFFRAVLLYRCGTLSSRIQSRNRSPTWIVSNLTHENILLCCCPALVAGTADGSDKDWDPLELATGG